MTENVKDEARNGISLLQSAGESVLEASEHLQEVKSDYGDLAEEIDEKIHKLIELAQDEADLSDEEMPR